MMIDGKWIEELKTVISKLSSYSKWLYYMGIIYIVGSISQIAIKSFELASVFNMHTIGKGNNQNM